MYQKATTDGHGGMWIQGDKIYKAYNVKKKKN